MDMPYGIESVESPDVFTDAFFDVFFERLKHHARPNTSFLMELPALIQTGYTQPLCFISFRYTAYIKPDTTYFSLAFVLGRTAVSFEHEQFKVENIFSYTNLHHEASFISLKDEVLPSNAFSDPIEIAGFGSSHINIPLPLYLEKDEAKLFLKEQFQSFCSHFDNLYLSKNYLNVFMRKNHFPSAMPPTSL